MWALSFGSRSTVYFWRYSFAFQRKLHAEAIERSFYDIIIVGGGMVGTTLACKLAHNTKLANKNLLLLEGAPEREWFLQPWYSNRVSALNLGTKSLLASVGAWKHVLKSRCKPVKKMQVWEALSDSVITFCHDGMIQDVAYIVENDVLLAAVDKVLKESVKNVTVLYNTRVKCYQFPARYSMLHESDGLVHLELENGRKFCCSLLIGADGVNSQVRRAMGVQYLSWSYGQMAIVATVRLSERTENVVAWQRFLPTGPVALLPLTDELSSLVWSTTTEQAQSLLQLSDECFVDALNEALWKQHPRIKAVDVSTHFLDSVLESILLGSNAVRQLPPSIADVEEGSRAAFPLGFGHSASYVARGVALVGDAAHRIHPLAGQGVNLGFGDVCCLSEMLSEAVGEGRALGSLPHLHQYETLRQRHNVPIMLAVDGLQKLYRSEFSPVVMLRSVGLQLSHALNPVKKLFMDYAAM